MENYSLTIAFPQHFYCCFTASIVVKSVITRLSFFIGNLSVAFKISSSPLILHNFTVQLLGVDLVGTF